jgi:phage shock protein A
MDRARQEEMERMGLSQDILDMARDIGLALENSNEGLQAVQNSLETQQRFAKRLDADVKDLYERAKAAIANADEDLARKLLLERTDLQAKLKKVLISCAEEKGRLKKMEENVAQLQRKAMEVDSLLRRNVSAKTIQDSTDLGLALRSEDPLLQKLRDMGID